MMLDGYVQRPVLSLVIPAYNEERRLPRTLVELRRYESRFSGEIEVLVVDDGSEDGTIALVERERGAMDALRLIRQPHRGKGAAVRAGMLAAHGRWIVLCDADLSMPVEQLDRFVAALRAGADLAIGSRELPDSRRFGEPGRRHLMGRVFNALAQALLVRGINDTQCGFKGFQRAVARDLFSVQRIEGFSFDAEILFVARRRGYRLREVPIDWHFDADSRVRPGIDTWAMSLDLLRVRYHALRGRYHRAAMRSEDVVRSEVPDGAEAREVGPPAPARGA